MEIIRGLHNLKSNHRGSVLTIGNFDGVHLGHRAILAQLADISAREGLTTTLMTFEPHPREFFLGDAAPPRLTRFKEKMLALMQAPPDRALVLRFDRAFSRIPADDFIERYLVEGLGIRHLVVGDDFRFGHGAKGNFELLQQAAKNHGFRLTRRDQFRVAGRRVSSSRVREALETGKLDVAAELLGRTYSILGRVTHGRGLGRTIGFPTANLTLKRHVCPMRGVYAVRVSGLSPSPVDGMANIGTRPTVDGTTWMLEVHLFDFDETLYGKEIEVHFAGKLRDEQRFDSVALLAQQLAADAVDARSLLSAQKARRGAWAPA